MSRARLSWRLRRFRNDKVAAPLKQGSRLLRLFLFSGFRNDKVAAPLKQRKSLNS